MKKPSSYLNFFPLILGVAGAVALCSYISPWAAVKPDSTIYLRMAEEIQKGYWHIDQWGRGAYSGVPMYPMLVALVEWVIPGLETAGTLAAIMPAAIVVVPLFFLARHFYGKKAAWIVIPLTIFNPWYLDYASLPLTEALFTLLFLSGILLLLYALTKNSPKLWFATGVVSAAAWVTRDAGIILPFLSFLWLIVSTWKNRGFNSNMIKNSAGLIIGLLLIYAPLKIVLTMDHKSIPDPPPAISVTSALMAPDLRDLTKREIYFGKLTEDGREYAFVETQKNPPKLADVLRNWNWVIQRFGYNLAEIAKSTLWIPGVALLVFIIIGIIIGKGFKREESGWFPDALIFLGSYAVFYLLFYALAGAFTGAVGPERYLVPLIPLFVIWATHGIMEIEKKVKVFNVKHLGTLITLLCIGIILTLYIPGIKVIKQKNEAKQARWRFYERLGIKIRDLSRSSHDSDKTIIMARAPFLPYYAGASWVILPYGSYQEIITFVKYKDVDFLFLEMGLESLHPQLSFLLNSKLSVPEMERVYWLSPEKGSEKLMVALYRIKK